jgi:hypothetical protein
MDSWDPAAIRAGLPDAGRHLSGPYRIVLHSTEGTTYGGALGAYKADGSPPHFTGSYEGGRFRHWQHIALDRSAKALEHREGTVHTNRLSAVQIEIVGFADATRAAKYGGLHVTAFPAAYLEGIADLIAWIRTQVNVKPVHPTFKAYPASYGERNGVRFSATDWLAFNGVCGHQHVPNQNHGDPGAIDIAALLPAAPVPRPPYGTVYDYEEATIKAMMIHVGPLDANGNGWADWQPGLGRDPAAFTVTLWGPSPPDDNYWLHQKNVTVAAQPRGGALRVSVRNGTPGDTVIVMATVA